MSRNQVFDELGRRLLSRGMPWQETRRYLAELRDHRADLITEGLEAGMTAGDAHTAADERLGQPRELADAALEQFRRRTFMGRRPWLAFGVWPVLCLLLTWIVVAMAVASVGHWLLSLSVPVNDAVKFCTPGVCAVLNFSVPILLAIFFHRAASHRAMSNFWRFFACGFSLFAAIFCKFTIWFTAKANSGTVALGAGHPSFSGFLPLIAVLMIGIYTRHRATLRALAIS